MGDAAAELAHDLLAPPDGGDRIAVGHGLGHGADVGPDAVKLLGAATGDAEAGLHLINDHEDAVLGAQLAHGSKELGLRGNAAAIAQDRLDQHRRDIVRVRLQHGLETIGVIVGHLPEQLADQLGQGG